MGVYSPAGARKELGGVGRKRKKRVGRRQKEEVGCWEDEREKLEVTGWWNEIGYKKGGGRTEDMPTPMRTPRERTSHQRKAPTRPAAPVPDAKYL